MIRVTENFRKIQELLAIATSEAKRPPGSVRLLSVSKKKPLAAILEVADAGQRDFGENFVQEAVEKIKNSGRDDLIWHFIGHLQSNKTRDVAEHFQWVHTIDRLKIAKRLSAQRPHDAGDLNVCLEVNIDDEPQKSGISPGEVPKLAAEIAALPRLKLRGLMCLPIIEADPEQQLIPFAKMRALHEKLRAEGLDVDTLSMGMSADYAAAIKEGATIVRVGTAIFGKRE
ncbi:MAG: YggS family pyridoxal phosphate-dependent enzyme [Woeseia sp.]|nr:YggS family pyridoxal phosphate-dependent enzyme [Woeseia sp.]MBT6210299.1 YggS family pyridoxal phosphate-dependent enzyme [Woeseia sp.]